MKTNPIYAFPPLTTEQLATLNSRLQSKMRVIGYLIDQRREQALRKQAFKRIGK